MADYREQQMVGSVISLPTFTDDEHNLLLDRQRKHIRWLIDNGIREGSGVLMVAGRLRRELLFRRRRVRGARGSASRRGRRRSAHDGGRVRVECAQGRAQGPVRRRRGHRLRGAGNAPLLAAVGGGHLPASQVRQRQRRHRHHDVQQLLGDAGGARDIQRPAGALRRVGQHGRRQVDLGQRGALRRGWSGCSGRAQLHRQPHGHGHRRPPRDEGLRRLLRQRRAEALAAGCGS